MTARLEPALSLQWFFLESVAALGVVLFLVNFALLVNWRRRGKPRPLLVGLVLAAGLLSLSLAVVTPREHAGRILRAIERGLTERSTEALARALSPEFRAERMTADDFLAMVRDRLDFTRVIDLRRTDLRITRHSPDEMTVQASYLADIDSRGGFRGYFTSRWELRFARRDGEWRITTIAPVHLQGRPASGFEDIPR